VETAEKLSGATAERKIVFRWKRPEDGRTKWTNLLGKSKSRALIWGLEESAARGGTPKGDGIKGRKGGSLCGGGGEVEGVSFFLVKFMKTRVPAVVTEEDLNRHVERGREKNESGP